MKMDHVAGENSFVKKIQKVVILSELLLIFP